MTILAVHESREQLFVDYNDSNEITKESVSQKNVEELEKNLLDYENSETFVYYIAYDDFLREMSSISDFDFSFQSEYKNSFFVVDRNYKQNEVLDKLQLSLLVKDDVDINFLKAHKEDFKNVIMTNDYQNEYLKDFDVIRIDPNTSYKVLVKFL